MPLLVLLVGVACVLQSSEGLLLVFVCTRLEYARQVLQRQS